VQNATVPNGAVNQQPNPSQKEIYDQLIALLGKPRRTLEDSLSCGELLSSLKQANPKYGGKWMPSVRAELERHDITMSRDEGYRLIKFFKLFSDEKGRELIAELGGRVRWESFVKILPVKDSTKREAILRQAARERLSIRQVQALTAEKTEYRPARGGRRPRRLSGHPNRALRDLRALASKWTLVREAWVGEGDNALQQAARLKPEEITDDFRANLQAMIPVLVEMTRSTGQLASELKALSQTLEAPKA